MPKETFKIRIKRDGTIRFGTEELSVERMRLLRQMLEETLGPTEIMKSSDDASPSPGVLIAEKHEEHLESTH